MKRALFALLVCAWLACGQARAEASTIWLHTREVEALALYDGAVWAATSGGLERYLLPSLTRTHHFTTRHGLDSPHVRALSVRDGQLVASTAHSVCSVGETRVRCEARASTSPQSPTATGRSLHGARVTAELSLGERTLVATWGAGLWLVGGEQDRRLTPEAQLCGHHVQAAALFRGELWLGGFRDGLCVRRGTGFASVEAPFRYVNDMLAVGGALYVAANEGLFITRDGEHFLRLVAVPDRGVNGLARAGDTLWVSTPSAVYALRGGRRVTRHLQPAGSSAIQAVAAHENTVWLATEDRGLVRISEGRIEAFDRLRGLGSSWTVDVELDGAGGAYAATLRDGLFHVTSKGEVTRVEIAPRWLLRLARRGSRLWVLSQEGALLRDGGGELLTFDALPHPSVHMVLEAGALTYLGTEHGLVELASRANEPPRAQ